MMLESISTQAGAIVPEPAASSVRLEDPELQEAIRTIGKADSEQVHLVWDTVWWRKVVYFLTILLAAMLGAYPITADLLSTVFRLEAAEQLSRGLVSTLVDSISGLIPTQLSPWVVALTAHPILFAVFAAGLLTCLYFGRLLATRTADRARFAWHSTYRKDVVAAYGRKEKSATQGFAVTAALLAVLAAAFAFLGVTPETRYTLLGLSAICMVFFASRWRQGSHADAPHVPPTMMLDIARKIRRSAWANALDRVMANRVWPGLFMLVLLYAAIGIVNRVAVDVTAAAGYDCKGQAPTAAALGLLERRFPASDPCWATGVSVQKGIAYRIRIKTHAAWKDAEHKSPVAGFEADTIAHVLGAPLKRWFSQKWFAPIARVGVFGNEEYALKPLGSDEDLLVADFTPRSSGPLFLYVNDAMPLLGRHTFYENNSGEAQVTVERRPTP